MTFFLTRQGNKQAERATTIALPLPWNRNNAPVERQ